MSNTMTRRRALRIMASSAAVPLMATTAYAAAHAQPTTHTVTIQNMAFNPANLTIKAGDTVIFRNEDRAPHDATANNGAFKTPRLNAGQSSQLTFPGAATYSYICSVHPRMTGSITVT
ncbi:Plastocyanin [Loktanella sp. DSM 29012]|uniref:cupredoxin domain-containing protein n=1 Tax=Loktanella sp. DSM 29012 TaxID=1881056 RepID=UPI0008C965FC|nr:cupredoxin family copper-binding protein [Loktanella sp. DSM 29012]SEQ69401.1 Plastocyanin [Loktanella sp. DSM 29012]